MSLVVHELLRRLPAREQQLVAYVRGRISLFASNLLIDFLSGVIPVYVETIDGEWNSIKVWAEEFGVPIRQ